LTLVRIKDKFEEASILQRFRNNYLGFPLGKITQLNNPDVVIEGDLTVGIEITQVSKDQDSPTGSL